MSESCALRVCGDEILVGEADGIEPPSLKDQRKTVTLNCYRLAGWFDPGCLEHWTSADTRRYVRMLPERFPCVEEGA